MGAEFDRIVDAAYWGKAASELRNAPTHVLRGVSPGDAEKLEAAFGIATIAHLAESPYFKAAAAICDAARSPGFDPGPPQAWRQLFASAPLAAYEARPDLFRLDFGPVFYRGRLDGTARLLVVGQDPSVNEILAQRVFIGQSGQRLQGFLAKLGVERSYLMLNTFSFSIFDQFGGDNATLSHQDPILAHRNRLFDAVVAGNPLQAVITVGTAAREAIDRWPGIGTIPRAHIPHPSFPDVARLLINWNAALAALRHAVDPDDGGAVGPDEGAQFSSDEVVPIPRGDLSFGLPPWHGVGDHGKRVGDTVIEWRSPPVI